MTIPTLTRGVLRLREFTDGDTDALHRVYGDPVATRHLSFEVRSRDQVAAVIAGVIARRREDPRSEYALAVDRTDGVGVVGMARLVVGENRSGQIGFALRPDQWGQGFGRQSTDLLLDLAFDHLGLHRVWGARAPENEASRRVMLSLGMLEEGCIRDHVPVPGGWRDSVVHSILEGEWRERRLP